MKPEDSPAAKSSSAKILLVDGNQNGLTARGMILREQGYTVETATTGEEAWELLRTTHFDVVVTIYGLKGMTGAELIAKVHGGGLTARVVMLMTNAESLSLDANLMGADETISKSNREVGELVRAVRKLADGKPKRRPPGTQTGPSGTRRRAGGGKAPVE